MHQESLNMITTECNLRKLIRKLAQDEIKFVRNTVTSYYDLSKLSNNTNESLLRSYIKYLL